MAVLVSIDPNEISTRYILLKVIAYQHCYMVVRFDTWTTGICRKSQYHGISVSDVFSHAVGEKALNDYNIFVTHCQYHTCYTGKSCIALILLFYSCYLLACTKLWVVCIMCCQTTRSENWFGTHLPRL